MTVARAIPIRLTWVDQLVRPADGPRRLFIRAVYMGAGTFALSVLPLLCVGRLDLVIHPLIVLPALGVVWVIFCTLLINRQRTVIATAQSFFWADSSDREFTLGKYLAYINNDGRSLTLSFAAWIIFQLCVILPLRFPGLQTVLPTSYLPIASLRNPDATAVLIAVALPTLLGGSLAATAGRFLRGEPKYVQLLMNAHFDVPLANLRSNLQDVLNITMWGGAVYSGGLAVCIVALDLNPGNALLWAIILAALYVMVGSYLRAAALSNALIRKRSRQLADELMPRMLPPVGIERLEIELANEAIGRLSAPIVNWVMAASRAAAIASPFALILLEDPVKHAWAGLGL